MNLKNEEIPQDDAGVQDIFYGEEVKIRLQTEGATNGTELLIQVKAVDNSVELVEEERQPLSISVTVENDEAISEPFYVNPKWFDRENTITYIFDVKLKEGDSIIAENLPEGNEKQLTPVGFGKPDKFKIDGAKGYLLERKSNGSKLAYTSGNMEDIEMYQSWFEDDSEELDVKNTNQIQTYFNSVYMTRLYRWSPKGEYGNAANRSSIIAAFEKAATNHGVPASILFTYAAGEGMQRICSRKSDTDLSRPVQSFRAFGLDFFEQQAAGLKKEGYLSPSFSTNAKASARRATKSVEVEGETITLDYIAIDQPNNFNGGKYAIIRFPNGSKYKRSEAADNGKEVDVYPVLFKDLLTGIEGACAVYAKSYSDAQTSSENIGWGKLTLNQNMFFGYFKIQKTSTEGNAELNLYRKKADANFYDKKYSSISQEIISGVLDKCYRRYVAWRYILLGDFFTE